MPRKKKKLNKRQRQRLEHVKAVKNIHDPATRSAVLNNNAIERNKAKNAEATALPPRTAHYDKRTKTQKSGAVKISENANEVTYGWTEDRGGEAVHIKKRSYFKDHAKARTEDEWTKECGNHCKINKDKFDEGYNSIFGERQKGAAAGKFKKTKKVYK